MKPQNDKSVVTIQRSTLRKIVVLVAVGLTLGAVALAAGYVPYYFLREWKDYLGAQDVRLRQNELLGQRVRVRGYIQNSGIGQTIQACDPPEYTFTRFSLSSIDLMDCELDQCTMTCPLFMPHIHEAYEIVGTLTYCSNRRLCLTNITEIYRLEDVPEELVGGQEIPVAPGPASFRVGQQWQP